MSGSLAGVGARVAAGLGLVACAAIVAAAVGGHAVFGGLGSLFGASEGSRHTLQVAKETASAGDIVAAPATTGGAGRLISPARTRHGRTPGARHRAAVGAPAHRRPAAQPEPAGPAPQPSQPLPPPPQPVPNPGSGQVVSAVAETVKQVAKNAPAPAQPLLQPADNAVDALVQTCRSLAACP